MKLFVSGPMRGLPRLNADAFHECRVRLRSKGHLVTCPMEWTLLRGIDPDIPWEDQASGFDLNSAARYASAAIGQVDAVVMLPGWEGSVGARWEYEFSCAIGCPCVYLSDDDHFVPVNNRPDRFDFEVRIPVEGATDRADAVQMLASYVEDGHWQSRVFVRHQGVSDILSPDEFE